MELTVHNKDYRTDMPFLLVLRDGLNMTSTKYDCGIAQCGACIVHIDVKAARSCEVTLGTAWRRVTTIEGLGHARYGAADEDRQCSSWPPARLSAPPSCNRNRPGLSCPTPSERNDP